MAKLIELQLRASGPNHVPNPFRDGWIGRRYSAESEEWSDTGPETIRATPLEIAIHAKFLRDAVAEGELTCENAPSALALGLAFVPAKTAPAAKKEVA